MKSSAFTILLILLGITSLGLQGCASKSSQPAQNDIEKALIEWKRRVANPIAKSSSEILKFEIRLPDNVQTLPNTYRPNSKTKFACSDYVIQNYSLFRLKAPFNTAKVLVWPSKVNNKILQDISCSDGQRGQFFVMSAILYYCDEKSENQVINYSQVKLNDLFNINYEPKFSNLEKKEIRQFFKSGSLKSVLDKILFEMPSSNKRNFLLGCFTILSPGQDEMEYQKLEANIFKIDTQKSIYPNNDSSGNKVAKKLKFEFYCFSRLNFSHLDKNDYSSTINKIYIFLNNKLYGSVILFLNESFYIGRPFTSAERAKFLRQIFEFEYVDSESAKFYNIKTKV